MEFKIIILLLSFFVLSLETDPDSHLIYLNLVIDSMINMTDKYSFH